MGDDLPDVHDDSNLAVGDENEETHEGCSEEEEKTFAGRLQSGLIKEYKAILQRHVRDSSEQDSHKVKQGTGSPFVERRHRDERKRPYYGVPECYRRNQFWIRAPAPSLVWVDQISK